MRFFFLILSLFGFVGLGLMVFLTDPLQLGAFEFLLFYTSFFVALGSLFVLLLLLVERQLHWRFAEAVRAGMLLGASITFLLFLQTMHTLNLITLAATVGVVLIIEALCRIRK